MMREFFGFGVEIPIFFFLRGFWDIAGLGYNGVLRGGIGGAFLGK